MFFFILTGAAIEKLCELQYEDSQNCLTDGEMSPSVGSGGGGTGSIVGGIADKGSMVRAARCLLAAVTQVLLLADTIVVKQLLQAKDKVPYYGVNITIVEYLIIFSRFILSIR